MAGYYQGRQNGYETSARSPSFIIPKGNLNPWIRVWEKLIKQHETCAMGNHYYHPSPSPILWGRRLLVFARQVKRKASGWQLIENSFGIGVSKSQTTTNPKTF
jgi:hypothetical protein